MAKTSAQLSDIELKVIDTFFKNTNSTVLHPGYLKLAASLFEYVATKQQLDKTRPEWFASICSALREEMSQKIQLVLGDPDLQVLVKNYKNVMKYALEHFIFTDGGIIIRPSNAVIFSEPKEISSFINSLLEVDQDETIYTPFAGYCTHIQYSQHKAHYVGEEINSHVWAVAQLNIFANDLNADIQRSDSFDELRNSSTKFDKILFLPPFTIGSNKEDNIFTALRNAIDNKLKNEGRLIALLPLNFAYASDDDAFELRKFLIEKQYIYSIITLPAVLRSTPVKPCILIIDKERQEELWFADFSNFSAIDEYIRLFSYKSALEAIEQSNLKYIKNLPYSEIKRGETLNLTPSLKLYKLPKTSYPVERLTNLVRIVPSRLIRNIEANLLELNGTPINEKFEQAHKFTTQRKFVQAGIQAMPNSLVFFRKPVLQFGVTGDLGDLFDTPCVAPLTTEFFEVISDKVTKEYLEVVLNQEFVMDQFEVQHKEQIMMNRFDFSEIMVPVPSQQEQEMLIERFHTTERLKNERLAKVYSKRAGIRDMSLDLKHMLGTPLSNVFNAIASLDRLVSDNAKASKYITQIKDNLGYAKRIIIRNGVDFTDQNDFPKEKIYIYDFFELYKNSWGNYGSKSFTLEVKYHLEKTDYIYGNPDALRIMLDALLENAHRHGFMRKYKESNKVSICLLIDDTKEENELFLQVENNGRPLPADFTLQDFITAGKFASETGHSGLGGKHIYDITRSFGGEIVMGMLDEFDDNSPIFQFYIPANCKP